MTCCVYQVWITSEWRVTGLLNSAKKPITVLNAFTAALGIMQSLSSMSAFRRMSFANERPQFFFLLPFGTVAWANDATGSWRW